MINKLPSRKKNLLCSTFLLLLLIINFSAAKAQWIDHDSTLTSSGSYPSLGWPAGVVITIPVGETVTVTASFGGGDLYVYGNLIVTGGLQINGNMEILPGASMTTGGDLTTMFVVVDGGAQLTVNGNYNTNNVSPFGLLSDYYNSGATVTINGTAHYNTGGLKLDTGSVLNTQELWFHNPNNYVYGTINNSGTLTIASGPETMDCPAQIITGSINNASSANAFHGKGYIKVSNSFIGANSFTADTTIVLDLSTATGDTSGNRGAASYGLTSPCFLGGTLPITLQSFTVEKYNQGTFALLQWQTVTEINNKGFYIERSSGSGTWQTLNFVHSQANQGNSTEIISYQYIDRYPNTGVNYYRLKQEDIDGHISYSLVRILAFRNSPELTLYPNPTSGRAVLKGLTSSSRIVVNNGLGKLVKSFKVNESEAMIDISAFADGIYFISVIDNAGNIAHFKLVKE